MKLWLKLIGTMALIIAAQTRDCTDKNLKHVMSQCVENKMNIIYYWDDTSCTNSLPAPIKQVPCSYKCSEGTYLGLDSENNVKCLDCPSDTFSTGNTIRFSSQDRNFDMLPKEVSYLCHYVDEDEERQVVNCNSWTPLPDNSGIRTEMKHATASTWNWFEFRMNVNLVEDGKVTFTYRKNSNNQQTNLLFAVDSKVVLEEKESNNEMRHQVFSLSKGLHELNWIYQFNTNKNYFDLYAEITHIEVTNVRYHSTTCSKCKVGHSKPGSAVCKICPENFQWNSEKEECMPCPEGYKAYEGESECKPRINNDTRIILIKKYFMNKI